ncbi:hypothetical protein ODJ79_41090 [Actinoplanes sp. KI2]|uniref:hypothetical protein n=1 Tax=Actinoplanes sp. KI2 TaxID=2983315 RepID=UPI0021D5AAE9|nr:hypothetical protein [Actinoplanes sp. KI2]MCU7730150.1 hypothetical protein [Actinoplanes sp. KI2]
MREIPPNLRGLLSEADLAEIAAHPITLGEGTERDAVDLVVGWAKHVEKIDTDRALPWEDHSVFNEHDLAAALHIRDFLERALGELNASVRERLAVWVAVVDEHFRSFTVDDPDRRMGAVADVDLTCRPWWWRRVPIDGPIAEDLTR